MNTKKYTQLEVTGVVERTPDDVRADIRRAERRLLKEMTLEARRALNTLTIELYRMERAKKIRSHSAATQPVNIPISVLILRKNDWF